MTTPATTAVTAVTALLVSLRQASLTKPWRVLATHINQRQPRERLLLCAAMVAVAGLLADALWLGPAYSHFRQARQAQAAAQDALTTLRQQASTLQQQNVQQAQHQRAELQNWRQRLRDGDSALRAHEASLVGADHMVGLLEQLLARHGEVRVRALRTLGRQDLLAPTAGAGQATAASGKFTTPSLYRHGVELVLEGGFADLLGYLRAMEALPQRVLFGSVSLKVEQHPRSVLTLRVYTLSRDPNWLEI